MLDREFWVGTEKHPLGREEGERGMKGGGGVRKNADSRNSLYSSLYKNL